jgi:putative endonuclease
MSNKNYHKGLNGELIVRQYYIDILKCVFLYSRFRGGGGEIDLIFKNIHNKKIIAVEVKNSSGVKRIEDLLLSSQIQRIYISAEEFLLTNVEYDGFDLQVDCVLLKNGKIEEVFVNISI